MLSYNKKTIRKIAAAAAAIVSLAAGPPQIPLFKGGNTPPKFGSPSGASIGSISGGTNNWGNSGQLSRYSIKQLAALQARDSSPQVPSSAREIFMPSEELMEYWDYLKQFYQSPQGQRETLEYLIDSGQLDPFSIAQRVIQAAKSPRIILAQGTKVLPPPSSENEFFEDRYPWWPVEDTSLPEASLSYEDPFKKDDKLNPRSILRDGILKPRSWEENLGGKGRSSNKRSKVSQGNTFSDDDISLTSDEEPLMRTISHQERTVHNLYDQLAHFTPNDGLVVFSDSTGAEMARYYQTKEGKMAFFDSRNKQTVYSDSRLVVHNAAGEPIATYKRGSSGEVIYQDHRAPRVEVKLREPSDQYQLALDRLESTVSLLQSWKSTSLPGDGTFATEEAIYKNDDGEFSFNTLEDRFYQRDKRGDIVSIRDAWGEELIHRGEDGLYYRSDTHDVLDDFFTFGELERAEMLNTAEQERHLTADFQLPAMRTKNEYAAVYQKIFGCGGGIANESTQVGCQQSRSITSPFSLEVFVRRR